MTRFALLLVSAVLLSSAVAPSAASSKLPLRYIEAWPADAASLPRQPKACWLTGDDCYPEPRNFIEAQWHESPIGDLDRARHIHLGAALPRIVRGVVRVDLRV